MAEDKKSTKSEEKPKQSQDATENSGNEGRVESSTKREKQEKPIREGYMEVKVYSPYQIYFDEEAKSISAVNDTGPFDILPQHHKFLTLLTPCELQIVTDNGEEKIKISRGIMYVKEDRVTVFLDV